jgi:23S rRNA (uracil1939-C5)-methyltransferase
MLQRIAPELALEPPITGPASGFRHRLRLQVGRDADKHYTLGLRQRGTHQAVSLQHCVVANATINSLLQTLPALLGSAPDLQGLREIEIDADSNNQLGVCFYFAAQPGADTLSALQEVVLGNSVIALRIRMNKLMNKRLNTRPKSRDNALYEDSDSEDTQGWQELHTEGELCLRLELPNSNKQAPREELKLAYLPGDFTQTHWEVNALLVSRALEWLQPGKDERALDLFSGIGNFSLPLARCTKTVHALEGDSSMTLRVGSNAEKNAIENISAKKFNLLADEVVFPRADIAIVDPPRAGAKVVCEALARSKVGRLVYVSCHPSTLLRDARVLRTGGFKLTKAAAVDMFPNTGHSEAIVLFERK